MEILNHIYTYQNALDGIEIENIPPEFDCLERARLNAFLRNPAVADPSLPMIVYSTVDDKVVGWLMLFPTRIVVDGIEKDALSASDFHVLEEYQHLAIGVDLALFPINNGNNKYLIYAGPSPVALKMYKKLRFSVLSMPYLERKESFCYRKGFKLSSLFQNVLVFSANMVLGVRRKIESISIRVSKFKIQQFTTIPEWVDSISNRDTHRFREVHNRSWLQWNLDNQYHGETENCQRFFGVFLNNIPIGFFMITERLRFNRVYGFLVEWDSINQKLTELTIIRLAKSSFSQRTERIGIAINDISLLGPLKRLGFKRKNDHNIVFRDSTRQLSESHLSDNWRLRYGYADVIMSS